MKLIKGKNTRVTVLKDTIRKTPEILWSAGKQTSRNLNALNPQEDIEQEEKKKKRRSSGIDPTKFMSPSEIKRWEKLPERKKDQMIRNIRLTEEAEKNPLMFRESSGRTGYSSNSDSAGAVGAGQYEEGRRFSRLPQSSSELSNSPNRHIWTDGTDKIQSAEKHLSTLTKDGGVMINKVDTEVLPNGLVRDNVSRSTKYANESLELATRKLELERRAERTGVAARRTATRTSEETVKTAGRTDGTTERAVSTTGGTASTTGRTASTTGRTASVAGKATATSGKAAASAGKTAASATVTVSSAAATAGTSLVADVAKNASKKIAKKFREKLQMEAYEKSESLRLTQEEQKRREDSITESGKHNHGASGGTDSNGLSTTVQKVISFVVAFVSAFMGAIASVLFYLLISIFIVFILLIIVISFWSKTGGTGRQQMVEAALAEYEVADQNIGGTKYKNWYGLDDNWCGMFVAYCANECGYISSGIIVKSASVSESKAWYEARDEFQTKESGYVPMPGDIIYFTNGMSHMGIVIEYDEATDHVIVIDGNSGPSNTEIYHKGSRVCRHEYARTAFAISGYATPAYPDQVSDLEGGSNAEKIYNGLVAQGYSEAAASAVIGNLYREAGVDAAGDIKLHSVNGDGSSIGIAQWTGGRKDSFLSFAEAAGEPWPDTGLEVQLNYMLVELSSNQWMWTAIGSEYGSQCNISLAEFKQLDDPEFATRVFCAMYERCHIYNAALPYRTQKALDIYNQFAN